MSEFKGYGPPRFTPIPDDFIDHQMATLSGAEVKVMMYIFRRTYGFKKSFDAISYNQFLRGVGELDQGAGVSRSQLNHALKALELRGLIFRHSTNKADRTATIYELNIDGESHWPSEIKPKASAKTALAPSAKNDLAPSAKNDLALVRKSAQQETESQETEDQHTELMRVLIQAGVSDSVATTLAAKAAANNRSTGYVAQWVKWIAVQSDIRNPGAYLATAIERNAEPPQELFDQLHTNQGGAYGWGGAEAERKKSRYK